MGCGGSRQRGTQDTLAPAAWGRPSTAGPKTTFKLVLLGAHFVGKTCISLRYCRGWTNLNELPTVGASFYAKNLEVNGVPIKFEIWDTAGQERYASLAPMYYRGADGALLVYDITNADSFEAMKKWDAEISAAVPECVKLIVGSKIDLVGSRQVPSDVVQAYSEERNIPQVVTSSKSGEGIEEAFNKMALLVTNAQNSSFNTLSNV